MAKGNEPQIKARRTSLSKKSNEELIDIILRKDDTERKNSVKIKTLNCLLNEADELNEEKANKIASLKDAISVKEEFIGNLLTDKDNVCLERDEVYKKLIAAQNFINTLRKVVFGLIIIIVILLILIII